MRRLKLLLVSLFLVGLVAFTSFSREAMAEDSLSTAPAAETTVQQNADQSSGLAESSSNSSANDISNETQPISSNGTTTEDIAAILDGNNSENQSTPSSANESSNSDVNVNSEAATGATQQETNDSSGNSTSQDSPVNPTANAGDGTDEGSGEPEATNNASNTQTPAQSTAGNSDTSSSKGTTTTNAVSENSGSSANSSQGNASPDTSNATITNNIITTTNATTTQTTTTTNTSTTAATNANAITNSGQTAASGTTSTANAGNNLVNTGAKTNNTAQNNAKSSTTNTTNATQTPAQNATIPTVTTANATQTKVLGVSEVRHTVQPGDSLWSIAGKYKTTVANLKALNRLTSDTIYVGQTLLVSQTQGTTETASTPVKTEVRTSYTVKAGDSLYLIGSWYGVSVAKIQAANGLKSTAINPGQKLVIPLGSSTGTTPPKVSGKATYYVRPGDTLYLIAKRFGVTVNDIQKASNVWTDRINPGQKLVIPVKTTTVTTGGTPATGTAPGTTPSTGNINYTVKAGDTLWLIAGKYGVTVAQIKTASKLTSDVIYPGQKLVIPPKGGNAGTGTGTGAGTSAGTGTTPNTGGTVPGDSANNGTQTYVVQKGDTYESVAWKFNVSVDALKAVNGFGPDRWLMAGETILIPRPTGTGNTNVSRSMTVTREEFLLLARVVYAEARGESYEGQVAVAAVVLNRVRHPDFPNTIAGVVYEPWAFTAVNDGQINLTPDETAMNAVQDALNGWDPTGGALYYWNPNTATSSWVWTRTITKTIGNHVFAI